MSVTAPLRTIADLPTPKGLPILGQMLSFRPLTAHRHFEQWARELGTPYRVTFGPTVEFTVWDDARLLQQISRERPDGYARGKLLQPTFQELNLNGLFSVEGAAWHPQRRLIMQALNATHFKGWFPAMADITGRLHRRWTRAAERGEVIDMVDELKRYTVDVTSVLAFGENPNTLETEGTRIQHALEVIFPIIMRRSFAPFRWWNHGIRLPSDRRLDKALVEVFAYARQRIANARARIASAGDDAAPRNALEALLMNQKEQGLSDDDVIANVVTLLIAGEDTTSNSLAWTMMYLAADPALQDRMHRHAADRLGAAPVVADHETLQQLDRFEPLALEALRLKPVVPFNSFTALHDVVIDGVTLPAGSMLIFVKRPAMLDPANFADPLRFDPDRWRRDRGAEAGPHEQRAFVQFGAGPRVCPGRHLATQEMRLVLSTLLRSFTVEMACDPATIEEVNAFTMMPDRMPVRLRLREARPVPA